MALSVASSDGSPAPIRWLPDTSVSLCPPADTGSHVAAGAIAIIGVPDLGVDTSTMSPWLEMPSRWPFSSRDVAVSAASPSRLPAGDCCASLSDSTVSILGTAAVIADRDEPVSATRRMAVSAVSARPSMRPAIARVSPSSVESVAISALWRSSHALRPSAPAIRTTIASTVHFRRAETLADALSATVNPSAMTRSSAKETPFSAHEAHLSISRSQPESLHNC